MFVVQFILCMISCKFKILDEGVIMKEAQERFLRYIQIDTQSDESSESSPSTAKQFDLAHLLVEELKSLGLTDAVVSDKCYVTATLPSNISQNDAAFGKVPTVAFLAHMDTSPDVSGAGVRPNIIENYQGGDIVLPADNSVVITESESPALKNCIGHTIITTDGTTLLGADDKAGIAVIMTAVNHLINNKNLLHGDIKVCFTPDEEVGRGADHFDVKGVGAKYAYTIDGEMPGALNKETFSANGATITATGRDIHPGYAKDVMVNSMRALADIVSRLPQDMAPETTDGFQPFIHPYSMVGEVKESVLKLLFRDFKTEGLDQQKKIVEDIIAEVAKLYPKTKIKLEIKESYRNMADKLKETPEVLDNLWEASLRAGVKPVWEPIRGGTDGSRLTAMGLPTPNIYGGGQNFHSAREWLSVNAMQQSVDTVINLAQIWVEKNR